MRQGKAIGVVLSAGTSEKGDSNMRIVNDEVLFISHEEANKYAEQLAGIGMITCVCDKCGIRFASLQPFTSDEGIICRICAISINLSENDNWDIDNYNEEDDDYMFEPYNENMLY